MAMLDFYGPNPFYGEEDELERAVQGILSDRSGAMYNTAPEAPRFQESLLQAQQQAPALSAGVAPDSAPPPVAGGGTPSPHAGVLATGDGPQWQQNLRQFVGSPGYAMARQAMQNRADRQMWRPVTGPSPAQAYQQSANANEVLLMRKAQNQEMAKQREQLAKYRAWQMSQTGQRKILKGADGYNYYQDTGERVLPGVTAEDSSKPSSLQEKTAGLIKSYGYPDLNTALQDEKFNEDYRGILGGNSLVNINTGDEAQTWEQADIQSSIGDYKSLMNAANQTTDRTNRLQMMRSLNEGMETGGPLGNTVTNIKSTLDGLGINLPGIDENTTYEQIYTALATQNQFERTALLKGAISERELDLAGRMDGSLANTQEGRSVILNYRLLEQQRINDLAEAADMYRSRAEAEGGNYRERDFRRSPEYKSLKSRPFMTRSLFEALRDSRDDDKGKRRFGDYVMQGNQWWQRDPEDSDQMIPVPFYGE